MARENRFAKSVRGPSTRVHIVLVPGFAGFDALGQLEYYAGVTPLFQVWLNAHGNRATAVLHYFDNFPTASVATRARRLRSYLAKRFARGEFAAGDEIALVGHSTGGLDIRRLICDLSDEREPLLVDGMTDDAFGVKPEQIRNAIKRIVFLSVPQWGTNIANWVASYDVERALVVADLRAAIEASQVPLVNVLQRWSTGVGAGLFKTNLLYALRDSLREAESDTPTDEFGTAMAQEAASLLSLWLRHIATDFSAIDDLRVANSSGEVMAQRPRTGASPAHFTRAERKYERRMWNTPRNRLEIRSYATLGPNPFRFGEGRVARWIPLLPCTYGASDTPASAGTDIVYRICYRACAGGPFDQLPGTRARRARDLFSGETKEISGSDNDGIVNTASMLWPNGNETCLVNGDHMDIVGHYDQIAAPAGSDRQYQAYDLLKSGGGFTHATFKAVWNDVFDFCLPRTSAA